MRSKSKGYYHLNNSCKVSVSTAPLPAHPKPPSCTLPPIKPIARGSPKRLSLTPDNQSNTENSMQVSHSHAQETKEGENICVILRIRPMLRFEIERGDLHAVSVVSSQSIELRTKSGPKRYNFNTVVSETATQQDMFIKSGVPSLLEAALEGYSASIFLYGQTGSGKTFTFAHQHFR